MDSTQDQLTATPDPIPGSVTAARQIRSRGLSIAGLGIAALGVGIVSGSISVLFTNAGLGPFDAGIHYTWLGSLIPPLVLVAALLALRRTRDAWPIMLLLGTLLLLPHTLVDATSRRISTVWIYDVLLHSFSAGTALSLVAVLAGSQQLINEQWPSTGRITSRVPALIGVVPSSLIIAAPWLNGTLLTAQVWNPVGTAKVNLPFVLAAVAGAVLVLIAVRRPANPSAMNESALPELQRNVGISTRLLVAGALAAFVPYFVPYLTTSRLATLTGVSLDSLQRHGGTVVAATGLLVLSIAIVLALISGIPATVCVVAIALIELGATGPIVLGLYSSASHRPETIVAAVTGLIAGALMAASRWRAFAAAVAALACAVALPLAMAATDGALQKLVAHGIWIPGALLMAGLIFMIATTVGVIGPVLSDGGGLPVVLATLLPLFVLGAVGAMTLSRLSGGATSGDSLSLVVRPGLSAALLVAGAVLLAGIGLIDARVLLWQGVQSTRR